MAEPGREVPVVAAAAADARKAAGLLPLSSAPSVLQVVANLPVVTPQSYARVLGGGRDREPQRDLLASKRSGSGCSRKGPYSAF